MLNCEVCYQHHHLLFTKCCKTIVCSSCSERQDKKVNCQCGRPLPQGNKNYSEHPDLLTLLKRFQEGKSKQCDRCDRQSDVQCVQCEMLYCQTCNSEVHAALGFSKHSRKKVQDTPLSFERPRKKQTLCLQHSQSINSGCQCGSSLCLQCLKPHKESCPRYKLKMLKQFKQQYSLNLLVKLRQLSFYKQRLSEDKTKYEQHFKRQQTSFRESESVVGEQFELIRKMLEMKEKQMRSKMEHYWKQCQKVYSCNIDKIQKQIRKYDEYAQLLQLFNVNLTNLDFFDKKIRKFQVPLEYLNLKGINFQHTQSSIMNIGLQEKPWELMTNDFNPDLPKQAVPVSREDLKVITSLQNTSQLILDYNHNPLKDRQLSLLPSHSEIFYNFIHLPYQNLNYEVQYGVGMKIKGQEIFKRVQNSNGYGVIEGLNPNTKYRVRMRVADGNWGTVAQVTTLDIPKFNPASSSFAKSMTQNTVQLGKGGIIYGSNQINFGTHRWVIKLTSKTISYQDSQTACLSVGVSNKEAKKAVFAGSTLNYGFQKSEIVLKIYLDLNEKRLVISNCTTGKEQVYQNLPNFPLFPTIQNKGNGQITVRYNLASDDVNSI